MLPFVEKVKTRKVQVAVRPGHPMDLSGPRGKNMGQPRKRLIIERSLVKGA